MVMRGLGGEAHYLAHVYSPRPSPSGPRAARTRKAWKPQKAVEVVLPTAAGGANDNVVRVIQKILQDQKLVPTPVVVMNKPGGNQTLGDRLRAPARERSALPAVFDVAGVRRRDHRPFEDALHGADADRAPDHRIQRHLGQGRFADPHPARSHRTS